VGPGSWPRDLWSDGVAEGSVDETRDVKDRSRRALRSAFIAVAEDVRFSRYRDPYAPVDESLLSPAGTR
jgi:hypothetical protein